MEKFSLVPKRYKEKDPRQLLYHFPSIGVVKYAKLMQDFAYYQALEVAETMANKQGFILLPWTCIHWERAKKFGIERKIKIGRNSFFILKSDELTKSENRKLHNYLNELKVSGKIS